MNKAEIRPLLVEALEKAKLEEEEIHREGLAPPDWDNLEALLEARKLSRLKRATAELQLWLADRQWEREEVQSPLEFLAQKCASPTSKT